MSWGIDDVVDWCQGVGMKSLTLRLEDELYEGLRLLAFEQHRSISDLLREGAQQVVSMVEHRRVHEALQLEARRRAAVVHASEDAMGEALAADPVQFSPASVVGVDLGPVVGPVPGARMEGEALPSVKPNRQSSKRSFDPIPKAGS